MAPTTDYLICKLSALWGDLKSYDKKVCALAQSGQQDLFSILTQAFNKQSNDVQKSILLHGLVLYGDNRRDKDVTDFIVNVAWDITKPFFLRQQALAGLGKLNDPSAIGELIRLVDLNNLEKPSEITSECYRIPGLAAMSLGELIKHNPESSSTQDGMECLQSAKNRTHAAMGHTACCANAALINIARAETHPATQKTDAPAAVAASGLRDTFKRWLSPRSWQHGR